MDHAVARARRRSWTISTCPRGIPTGTQRDRRTSTMALCRAMRQSDMLRLRAAKVQHRTVEVTDCRRIAVLQPLRVELGFLPPPCDNSFKLFSVGRHDGGHDAAAIGPRLIAVHFDKATLPGSSGPSSPGAAHRDEAQTDPSLDTPGSPSKPASKLMIVDTPRLLMIAT